MNYLKNIFALILCGVLFKCSPTVLYEKELGPNDGGLVYLTQAGQSQGMIKLSIFPPQESATQVINACFGGMGVSKDNITVQFETDQKAIDSLNDLQVKQGNSPYLSFPSGSFEINQWNVTIPAGENYSADYMIFKYYPKLFSTDLNYMTAFRIKDVSGGYPVNKNLRSVFLMVSKIAPTRVGKVDLTATADSEELEGESAPNGRAAAAVDGDVGTYWHSAWSSDPQPPYPHWLQVNLGGVRYISKIGLTRRQGEDRGFTDFDLDGSLDSKTWFNLIKDGKMDPGTDAGQSFPILTTKCQYIKLTMKVSAVGENFTSLSELAIYELK